MQIRIQARPGGSGCSHVHINDVNGVRLRTYTIPELRDEVCEGDDRLLAQIKRTARDSGITDFSLLKTYLESKDFDY